MSRVDELRSEITRARSGVRQAIEFAAPAWEQARAPRRGEDEVWSPRQTAEHVIAGEIGSASAVARALGGSLLRPGRLELLDANAALQALEHAAALADPVFASVTDEDLERATEVWGNVEGVMKFTAWHLRNHARQIAGIEQE